MVLFRQGAVPNQGYERVIRNAFQIPQSILLIFEQGQMAELHHRYFLTEEAFLPDKFFCFLVHLQYRDYVLCVSLLRCEDFEQRHDRHNAQGNNFFQFQKKCIVVLSQNREIDIPGSNPSRRFATTFLN